MNVSDATAEKPWWRRKLVDLFAIDPRSLAVFRIGIALVLLYDLVDRLYDFQAIILNSGILSVAEASTYGSNAAWSLYFLSAADWYQTLLFGLTFVSCTLLALGCFTRVATVATWLLIVSLHARMPLLLNGGDTWARVMLFWAIFLPLGRVWSIDAKRAGRTVANAARQPVLSIATAAILFQVMAVYFFAGIAKWNNAWLSGDAMFYVYDQLIFVRPLASHLLDYPWLVRFISYATLAFELVTPLIIFLPWGTKYLRLAAIAVVYLFHIGIELTLNVGHFSFVAFAAWTLFLPALFWDSALVQRFVPKRKRREKKQKPVAKTAPISIPARISKWAVAGFCAGGLAFLVLWNFSWIMGKPGQGIRSATGRFAHEARLSQRWRMFSIPYNIDPWYVYRAQLADGSVVDLIRDGQSPSDERPSTRAPELWNHRWYKMHNRLALATSFKPQKLDHYRHLMAEYICRKWNSEHDEDKQVVKLDVLCYGTEIGPNATPGQYSRATFATLSFAEPEDTSAFQDELLRLQSGDDMFTDKY